MYDLIIRDGSVVLEDEIVKADIGIKKGKIAEIAPGVSTPAKKYVDAKGKYVMPGMIDIHVHFDEPSRDHWEGFNYGSASMAAGGCTTYFDMPLNGVPPTVTEAALWEKKTLADQKSVVDYGLWGGLVPGNKEELAKMAHSGVIGFKAFMSEAGSEFDFSDDLTLYEGMKEIAKLNKVLALHAERNDLIQKLEQAKQKRKQTSIKDYLETRPVLAEVNAVKQALEYGEKTGCPLHFVHISSYEAVQHITEAKKNGMNVTLETCPHYLLFTEEDFEEIGVTAKCAPPLRSRSQKEKLWACIQSEEVDMISSDHSPCPIELKTAHQNDLFKVWGGISGGQYSLQAMISEGAINRGISLSHISKLVSTNPAKRFGLYPKKGSILLGSDADLVIVDLDQTEKVTKEGMVFKHKHSIYEGTVFNSVVLTTINRGTIVYTKEEGVVPLHKGQMVNGEYVKL
ncbi:allantoinase [Priestia aryabhattai]|uniref:Allantoinase n=1 Tax=Priestia aryabhattai TaxID=412384 RepID=A0ABD7X264_PRIAR|nr:allantoinase [Priestia aryabhattai]WEA46347.1 allantoinase [Priestia aryabhattai]